MLFRSYAIVFGVVASLALFATNKILASGGNEQPQPTVMLPKPTATPSALPTSTPTPEQETMAPEEPTSIDDVNTIIQDYEEMYDVFAKFCDSYSDTIVTVAKITEGTDCFQNPIESRDSFSGLVLHISSEQLYILTLYDGLEENNKYQIVFRNGESAEATVLGTDVVTRSEERRVGKEC